MACQSKPADRLSVLGLALALVAGMLPSTPALAQAPSQARVLAWHCLQQDDAAFHVLCVPRMWPAHAPEAATEVNPPGVNVNMLPVAQRGDAEVMSTQAWRIPLHVRPSDPAHVTVLLQSVLCGKRSQCEVSYGASGSLSKGLLTASRQD